MATLKSQAQAPIRNIAAGHDRNDTGSGGDGAPDPGGDAPGRSGGPGSNPVEEEPRQEDPQEAIHRMAVREFLHLPPPRTPPQQTGGAGPPRGNPVLPSSPLVQQHAQRPIDLWAPLDCSRKTLPAFK